MNETTKTLVSYLTEAKIPTKDLTVSMAYTCFHTFTGRETPEDFIVCLDEAFNAEALSCDQPIDLVSNLKNAWNGVEEKEDPLKGPYHEGTLFLGVITNAGLNEKLHLPAASDLTI